MHPIAQSLSADIRVDAVMVGETAVPRDLESVMARLAIPAVSIAVIKSGEIDWLETWGIADQDAGTRATPRTLFLAGSISKSIAAAAVLRFVADGKLELDEPVNDRLRSWKIPANDGWQPRLTVRQLLSHTAGLTMHGFPGYAVGSSVPSLPDVLSGRGNTAPVRVRTIPGFQYSYSGGGYLVLQQLLIDIAGAPFPEVVHDCLFARLGMMDSTYEQPLPPDRWQQAASGHRSGGAPVTGRWHIYPEMAAGGLWTTAGDLATFAIALRDAALGVDDAILPLEIATEMLRQQAPNFQVGLGVKFNEGIGLSFRGASSAFCFGHGGDDQGFLAVMLIYKDAGDGAVVMTNSDDGGFLIPPVLEAIARAYDWAGSDEPSALSPALPSLAQTQVLGTYALEGTSTHLELQAGADDELHLLIAGQAPIRLVRVGPRAWRGVPVAAEITFTDSTDGVSFVLRQDAMYVQEARARMV